eukprot:scaffold31257_cov83-Skeletonema_dohrnii-CCMP3373.AAC.1
MPKQSKGLHRLQFGLSDSSRTRMRTRRESLSFTRISAASFFYINRYADAEEINTRTAYFNKREDEHLLIKSDGVASLGDSM